MLLLVAAGSIETARSAANSDILINEVMFNPGFGGYQWVELKNTGTTAINLGGYRITNEQGILGYTIPAALPTVPSGALVVVVFDGAGSAQDDYNFSDNVATLHSPLGLVNILGTTRGQCALYSPSGSQSIYIPLIMKNFQSWNPIIPGPPSPFPEPSIRAFVAWGAPPNWDAPLYEPAADANKAGIWSPDRYIPLTHGLGYFLLGETSAPNETIGLLPGSLTGPLDNWNLYTAGQATKGEENPVPVVSWFNLANGAVIDGAAFQLGWGPVGKATGYRFQMSTSSDLSSPVEQILSKAVYSSPQYGTFYWRVKVLSASGESPWSEIRQTTGVFLTGTAGDGLIQAAPKILGIQHKQQLKDTHMLCLGGCDKSLWDTPHPHTETPHSVRYCARATISMMASFYGGQLSQDRITYQLFKDNPPEGDLGHGKGTDDVETDFWGEHYPAITSLLAWALGLNKSDILVQVEKPPFEQIKQWIDAGRPIMARIPGHIQVIDGYQEDNGYSLIHVLDPTFDKDVMQNYGEHDTAGIFVGPAKSGAPNVRSDEAGIWENPPVYGTPKIPGIPKDSDKDGIIDFDELVRFQTNPYLPDGKDSDYDGIEDKIEMMSYLFAENGVYLPVIRPDIDGDGLRKELDLDSDNKDNKGTIDGCEDINQDGIWQPGETRNNDPSDDKILFITLTWENVDKDLDLHLIKPGGQMWKNTDCNYLNKNPDWGKSNVGNLNCGDPKLDTDCITSCTVEHINLETLESGTYHVKVHYYSDHENGPESPKVNVWLQGKSYDFGPRKIADEEVWDVCTIDWPSKTVTAGGAVTSLSAAGGGIKPGK